MKDETYLVLRKIFFWLFFISFVVLVPILVFYSLGYKFDKQSKKLLRTGTISIKSLPGGANIFLDGKKLNDTTPSILSELLPKDYVIKLYKDGFYSYQIPVKVKPSSVSEFDITLIPEIRHIEKLDLDFNVYRFFISRHFYGNKIIAFTDQGVYYFDDDFKNDKKISSQGLNKDSANSLKGILEGDNKLVVWSDNAVWVVEDGNIGLIYTAGKLIEDIFFGLKEKYILIHDGLEIIALDIENPTVYYSILKLKDDKSDMLYDADSETIYTRERVLDTDIFSLYRSKLRHLIYEREKNQKVP